VFVGRILPLPAIAVNARLDAVHEKNTRVTGLANLGPPRGRPPAGYLSAVKAFVEHNLRAGRQAFPSPENTSPP